METESKKTKMKKYTQSQVDDIKSDLMDSNMRILADFENYKKRTSKEREEFEARFKYKFMERILDLDSDISLALKREISENEGLSLLYSKLSNFLDSHDVKEIQTDFYDPDLHEVVSIMDSDQNDSIIDVVSKGYTLSGLVMRYPKIILGKLANNKS